MEFFLQGAPPNYRVVLLHFIGTAKTTQSVLKGAEIAASHGGDAHPDAQILQTHAPPLPLPQKGLTSNKFSSVERVPIPSPLNPQPNFVPMGMHRQTSTESYDNSACLAT